MSFQDGSLDDLPLAAYSRGTVPDEAEAEPAQQAAPVSQQEAIARAAGLEPVRGATSDAKPRRGLPSLRRPKLPGPRVRPSGEATMLAPALTAATAVTAAAPDFRAVSANPAAATVAVPPLGGQSSPRPLPNLSGLLGDRRELLRDPRALAAGAAVAVGLVLLLGSMLGGGPGASAVGPGASPTAGVGAATPAPATGTATVELTKATTTTILLSGVTGGGPAAQSRVDSTWGDALGNLLTLGGPASAGTRTTDASFVLSWTVVVDGAPVTFTSRGGECTVGMALQPKSVVGSFVCPEIRSDDGKHVVKATGTYRT